MAAEPEQDSPADYETAKEWEFLASARSMLSSKPDIEQIPLFNPRGQQVGIGVGLLWSIDEKGEVQWRFEDDSYLCDEVRSCFYERLDEIGPEDE